MKHTSTLERILRGVALTLVVGLAAFGFYASRAGQPLFGNLELKT